MILIEHLKKTKYVKIAESNNMIKNAHIGDKVIVLNKFSESNEPLTSGTIKHSKKINGQKVLVAEWDYSKSNTGTVDSIYRSGKGRHRLILITVIPDPPNFGKINFTPKELRKIN